MARIEVTWTTETPEGGKRHVCARTEGDRWVFLEREKRFDDWGVVAKPPLEHWLVVLDGVRRRRHRRRATDRDVRGVEDLIRRHFPGARLD